MKKLDNPTRMLEVVKAELGSVADSGLKKGVSIKAWATAMLGMVEWTLARNANLHQETSRPITKVEQKMEKLGFTEGGTGGGCTAFYMSLADGREIYIADECEAPTRLSQPVVMELINTEGYSVEIWLFDKVSDFFKAWES